MRACSILVSGVIGSMELRHRIRGEVLSVDSQLAHRFQTLERTGRVVGAEDEKAL
jgi:hypothetical protein